MPAAGRPDLHVVARFLERLATHGPMTRSRLQRVVGLNYDLFRKYLEILLERGLVKQDQDRFGLSDDGHRVRRELVAWLTTLFGGRL